MAANNRNANGVRRIALYANGVRFQSPAAWQHRVFIPLPIRRTYPIAQSVVQRR